jgi:polygalacturonase
VTIAAGFSAAAADVLAAISGGTTNAINACTPTVTTVGALRALTSSSAYTAVVVRGYAAAGDGGGGTYILNSSDTVTADNGGTIIVDASARRWYLRTGGQPPSVKQFGAKGDGTTNDSAAFTASAASGEGVIIIPKGTYLLSSAISLSSTITWIVEFGASFTGAAVGANVALPGMMVSQGSTISPLGNALPTFCYMAAQGNNVSATTREFAFVAGVRSQFGNGTTGQANTDKVALFGGAQAANGSFNIFGINTSTIVEVGNTTNNGAWGYECDLNNKARHFGNTEPGNGIVALRCRETASHRVI